MSKPKEKTKSLNTRLIINVKFSSNVIGLKAMYVKLIGLLSCNQTACNRTVCNWTVR